MDKNWRRTLILQGVLNKEEFTKIKINPRIYSKVANHVVQESHVAVDVIPHESPHDSTDVRHESAVLEIIAAEPSMGHFSYEKICENTLQRGGKSAARAVAEDVKVTNKLLRSKIVCTPRKSIRLPVKANQKSPLDTSHRSFSKSKEEFAATIREPFTPRKKLKVKGPAQRKHLPVNVASTSALVSKEKLKDKESSNLEDDDILKALAVHEGKLELYQNVPACVPSVSRHRQHGGRKADARSEVRMVCRRFQSICRFIVQAVEQRSLKVQRVDLAADVGFTIDASMEILKDSSIIAVHQTSTRRMFFGTMMTKGCPISCSSLRRIFHHYRS